MKKFLHFELHDGMACRCRSSLQHAFDEDASSHMDRLAEERHGGIHRDLEEMQRIISHFHC